MCRKNLKNNRFIKVLFFISIVFFIPVISYSQQADKTGEKKDDELAHVGIIPFEDRTKTPFFQYMSESLGDAINISMIKEFSYIRIEPVDIKSAIQKAQNELKKTGTQGTPRASRPNDTENAKKKKKTPEQIQQDEAQLKLVKKIAQSLNSDIVIFGNYFFDDKTNELVFTASIYLALSDSVKELDETRNVVDNTIFMATDKVAKSLVAEIHNMIKEAEKIASEKKDTPQTDNKEKGKEEPAKKTPGEKTAITRKVAMATKIEWASKKFSIGLEPGFYMNDPPDKGCGVCQLQTTLRARFWVNPNFYLGFAANAGVIEPSGVPFIKEPPKGLSFDGIAFAGYSLPVARWLFSADAGGGYYLLLNAISGERYYNPVFGARINTEVLLADVFSLGLSLSGHMYYDQPIPLVFGGITLNLNFVF